MTTVIVNTNELADKKYNEAKWLIDGYGWSKDIALLGVGGTFIVNPSPITFRSATNRRVQHYGNDSFAYDFPGDFYLLGSDTRESIFNLHTSIPNFYRRSVSSITKDIDSTMLMWGNDEEQVYFCSTEQVRVQYAAWPTEETEAITAELQLSISKFSKMLNRLGAIR